MSERVGRPESYIGVSGVVSPLQQEQIELLADEADIQSVGRRLLLGVKATHKAQFLDRVNKYGTDWYPVGAESFAGAIAKHSDNDTMAVAQVFFDLTCVQNSEWYRKCFSDRIFERGSDWIDGIQFDMLRWDLHQELLEFVSDVKKRHDTKVLLQCHGPAMEGLKPAGVIKQLGRYANVLDYVLFDASHGQSRTLDPDNLLRFLSAAYESEELSEVGFGVAGGLDAETVQKLMPVIIQRFPDISWDAEGKLHLMIDDRPDKRPLDMNSVGEYLHVSKSVIC